MRHLRINPTLTGALFAASLLLIHPREIGAANRVGDADNNQSVEIGDAALILSYCLGTVGPTALSPLALADGDGDLDLADTMWVAQAAHNQRIISGPGAWASLGAAADQTVDSSWSSFPMTTYAASLHPQALKVDGLMIDVQWLVSNGEATLATPVAIAGGEASTDVSPIHTGPLPAFLTIQWSFTIHDSSGGAPALASADQANLTINPSTCSNGVVQPGETCDDGAMNGARDRCDLSCGDLCGLEFDWVSQGGGAAPTQSDQGYRLGLDDASNLYVGGWFESTVQFGATNLVSAGDQDAYLSKLDPAGNFQWAVGAGGLGFDQCHDATADGAGMSFCAGRFEGSADFGPYTLVSTGDLDAFLFKLDTNGNFIWVAQGGGTASDSGLGVDVDGSGNAYLLGTFAGSADFGPFTLTDSGNGDSFVAKLDPNGDFLWATQTTGVDFEHGTRIAVDGAGNAYITGNYWDIGSFGADNLPNAGYVDAFVAKLDSDGNFLWARRGGGAGYDSGRDVAVDGAGFVYSTGYFSGVADFGGTALTSDQGTDGFLAKLDGTGNYVWARRFGGSLNDYGQGVAVDRAGGIYLDGFFEGTAQFGSDAYFSYGSYDLFVSKLDSNGNFLWTRQAGGIGLDGGYGAALDGAGRFHVTGVFSETASFGGINLSSLGAEDMFVAKLSPVGAPDCFVCGDGILDPGETCDDGNLISGDGCDALCAGP